jgi:hypothetical protein
MIVYDLICALNHRFEGWFDSSATFQAQKGKGQLQCPICGNDSVEKLPSRVNLKQAKRGELVPTFNSNTTDGPAQQTQALLAKLGEYISRHFDDVGTEFAEEAKKIHYGETEPRNIRGRASAAEVKELVEEGIEAIPFPESLPIDKDKLN